MGKELVLKVQNLKVKFGKETIIKNCSFNLQEKETLVILGPNGAGKTVLLKALLGLIPYEGEIFWKKGVKISYVPQRLAQLKDLPLSVAEFFSFKKVSREKIEEVIKMVGLKEGSILEENVGTLSSGQFQRILVAWAFLDDPQVLLFDEPTGGIDLEGQETIYNLLEKFQEEKGLTIILISHDLNIVYKKATNVLCLNRQPICYGPPEKILNSETLRQLYGGEIAVYQHHHQ